MYNNRTPLRHALCGGDISIISLKIPKHASNSSTYFSPTLIDGSVSTPHNNYSKQTFSFVFVPTLQNFKFLDMIFIYFFISISILNFIFTLIIFLANFGHQNV
jgi:hypothetical protein